MVAAIERRDECAEVRNRIRLIADHVGEYAGIPLALEGEELVVEPSYRFAPVFEPKERERDIDDDSPLLRSAFALTARRGAVYIFEDKSGRVVAHMFAPGNSLKLQLHTMGVSAAWGIEQEHNALTLLATLIPHGKFRQYLLAGAFLETSKRSGVTYMFRKLRPTLALRDDGGQIRCLAALCQHPIAFYSNSYAGSMCPTDDVVAHLQQMRSDEHFFWRRSNQHQADAPEAGL
jgi:hypothetical protein